MAIPGQPGARQSTPDGTSIILRKLEWDKPADCVARARGRGIDRDQQEAAWRAAARKAPEPDRHIIIRKMWLQPPWKLRL